jgi:hypothetical protein
MLRSRSLVHSVSSSIGLESSDDRVPEYLICAVVEKIPLLSTACRLSMRRDIIVTDRLAGIERNAGTEEKSGHTS